MEIKISLGLFNKSIDLCNELYIVVIFLYYYCYTCILQTKICSLWLLTLFSRPPDTYQYIVPKLFIKLVPIFLMLNVYLTNCGHYQGKFIVNKTDFMDQCSTF